MKKNIDLSHVSAETWTRTIFLLLALINQVLAIFGKSIGFEFTEGQIYQVVSMVLTAISSIVAWWKNNSFSQSAQVADEVMHSLEGGELEYTEKVDPHTTDHDHDGVG